MSTQSPSRLVIRIKLPPREPPAAPERRPLNRGVLVLILGPVAVLLVWFAVSVFKSEPTPAPAPAVAVSQHPASAVTPAPAPVEAAPAAKVEPPQKPASALPVNEVVPEVSSSARNTISGTIRVTIRVIVAKDGTVLAATVDEPGPSRYFLRLSLESSRQWTFVPTDSDRQRAMLVTFYFKRSGTTARASPVP